MHLNNNQHEMCSVICVLCLTETNHFIEIFGSQGIALNISEIICLHFWLALDPAVDISKGICTDCWRTSESFNKFYKSIQKTHQQYEENIPCKAQHWLDESIKTADMESIKIEPDMISYSLDPPLHLISDDDTEPEVIESGKTSLSTDANSLTNNVELKSKKPKLKRTVVNRKTDNAEALEMEERIAEYFQMNCDLCGHKLTTLNDVQEHFKECHDMNNGYLKCCNRKFNMRKPIIEHVEWHRTPNLFRCTVCSKTFNAQRLLDSHKLSHHVDNEDKHFECDQCSKRFSRQYMLNYHVLRVHPAVDHKFFCDICQKRFKTKRILHIHVLTIHERINQHICDICAKVLSSKKNLQDHIETHNQSPIRRVQCNYCGDWLKNQSTLYTHMKRHTDSQQTCDICQKVLPTRVALNTHKRIVHGQAKHQCKLCEKAFKTLRSFREHTASHTGKDLYTCAYCPKTFKSSGNMYKHMKRAHFENYMVDKKTKKSLINDN